MGRNRSSNRRCRVGPRSDRAIAMQLDEVIQEFQPDSAVLVTGRRMTKHLFLSSHLELESIMSKGDLRQSKGIEITYYYITKRDDPRWRLVY